MTRQPRLGVVRPATMNTIFVIVSTTSASSTPSQSLGVVWTESGTPPCHHHIRRSSMVLIFDTTLFDQSIEPLKDSRQDGHDIFRGIEARYGVNPDNIGQQNRYILMTDRLCRAGFPNFFGDLVGQNARRSRSDCASTIIPFRSANRRCIIPTKIKVSNNAAIVEP